MEENRKVQYKKGMSSIALLGSSGIGGPLISNPSMWQLLSASAGHCNTRSHVTLENYTYMTLTHLLKCNFRTLVHMWHLKTTLTWHSNTCLHVTLKHLPHMWQLNPTLSWHSNTYMTLRHLNTQVEILCIQFLHVWHLNTFTTKLANTL